MPGKDMLISKILVIPEMKKVRKGNVKRKREIIMNKKQKLQIELQMLEKEQQKLDKS